MGFGHETTRVRNVIPLYHVIEIRVKGNHAKQGLCLCRPHCALVASQRGFGHETTGMRNVIPLDIECQSPDRLVAKKHVGFSGNRETKESKACPPLGSLKM